MRGRFIIASLGLALLFGSGFAVSQYWFAPQEHMVPQVVLPEPERPQAVETPEEADPVAPGAVLVSVEGRVLHTDEDGQQVEAQIGQVVPIGGQLHTEEGVATFELAETRVELFRDSVARIEPVEDGVSGLRLDSGRIRADSATGLRLRFANSGALAEVRDGELSAITDGNGQVAVASDRGTVRLSAEGETVEIRPGEQSAVRPQQPPSAPRRVPTSFFLRVRRPMRETRTRLAGIAGRTTPGSRVRVNGEVAVVDEEGRFRVNVPLREGRNQVEVDAEDIAGRRELESYPVLLDSRASTIVSDVSW